MIDEKLKRYDDITIQEFGNKFIENEEKIVEEELIKKLEAYVGNYDINNENIKRKYFHSIRVMKFAKDIAKSLNLNEHYIELAIVAGILHDYGRFEQWEKYNTYSDVDSIDHGDLGVKLLFEKNDIGTFYSNSNEYKQIYYAIKYHNKLVIPSDLEEQYVLICDIVIDADKLDIFDLLIDNKSLFEEDACTITDKVKKNFFDRKCINYKDVKNKSDRIVLLLAIFYDLKFDYSLHYIKKNHILDKMYEKIVNKEKYKTYFEQIDRYLDKKYIV